MGKEFILDHLITDLQNVTEVSDGCHTFSELYDFRRAYNAAMFNLLYKSTDVFVEKSRRHHDGELCFDGDFFIVVANLPAGLISNHYEVRHWGMFKIPSSEKSSIAYDGHTTEDVIFRLHEYIKGM